MIVLCALLAGVPIDFAFEAFRGEVGDEVVSERGVIRGVEADGRAVA